MRVLLIALCGAAASLASQAADTIVERLDLIDLRWAEASLAAGPGVTLPLGESKPGERSAGEGQEFPHLWRIDFFEGRRSNKTPGESGDKAVIKEEVRRIGSFYIVARFTEGREPAKVYGQDLETLLQQVDLPSLDSQFSQPTRLVEGALRRTVGDAQLVFCTERDDRPASSGVVHRSGRELESSVGGGGDALCARVRAGAAGAEESRRFRLGYEALAVVAETVQVDSHLQLDQPLIRWPAIVGLKQTPAQPGAGWSSSVSTTDAESISTESVPLTKEELAAGRTAPSKILEVRLRDGDMPLETVRGRGVILRFDVARAEKKLGALPRNAAVDEWPATVAFFLHDEQGEFRPDQFIEFAAGALAEQTGPLSPQTLATVASNGGGSMRRLDVLTVFCPSPVQDPPGARYCVRYACAQITNGGEFCRALESQFYSR